MQATQSSTASGEYGTLSYHPATFADTLAAAASERQQLLGQESYRLDPQEQGYEGRQFGFEDVSVFGPAQARDQGPVTREAVSASLSTVQEPQESAWPAATSAPAGATSDERSVRNAISRLARDAAKPAASGGETDAPRWQDRQGWRSRPGELAESEERTVATATTAVPPPPRPNLQPAADTLASLKAPTTEVAGTEALPPIGAKEGDPWISAKGAAAASMERVPGRDGSGPHAPASTSDAPSGSVSPTLASRTPVPRKPGRRSSDVALATGLAHDAGNLLSALGLYSELLCFSGVLHENHRHYAEDLKLLAVRSQALIERLIQLGEGFAGESSASPQDGPAVDDLDTERPASSMSALATAGQALAAQWPDSLLSGTTNLSAPAHSQSVAATRSFAAQRRSAKTEANSLVDLLMRFSSILSTLAHGALEINFGPQANLPIPVNVETIERVLVNLVRNAADAIRQGGSVRIGAGLAEGSAGERHGRCLALTVDDSGCGMTAEQIERVLHPGETTVAAGLETDKLPEAAEVAAEDALAAVPVAQASARIAPNSMLPATVHEGHGLGLHIVRELVAATGGTLQIYSQVGVGSRIEVRWPTVDSAADSEVNEAPTTAVQSVAPAEYTTSEVHVMRRRFNRADGEFQGGEIKTAEIKGAIAC